MKKLPCLLTAIVCGFFSLASASGDYDSTELHGTFSNGDWTDSYLYCNATLTPNAVVPGTGEGNVVEEKSIMPGVGFGFRKRLSNSFGWDSVFSLKTAGVAHQMDLAALVHYYLQPAKQDSMYLGSGLKVGSTWRNDHHKLRHFWCVDSVIGKVIATDTNSKHFIEMHLECPTCKAVASKQEPYKKDNKLRAANPVVYLTYGMAF